MADKDYEEAVEARIQAAEATNIELKASLNDALNVNALQAEQIAALQTTVDKLNAREEERKQAEAKAYVERIAKASADAGAPIAAEKLEKVQAAFDAGHADMARDLGDTLLALAEQTGGGSVKSQAPKKANLSPQARQRDEATEASIQSVRNQFKGRLKTLGA